MNSRNLPDVIDQILALLPNPAPPELADNLIVLGAQLRILKRTSGYTPPEALNDALLWQQLGTMLFRYLPNPAGYAFAASIATLVEA